MVCVGSKSRFAKEIVPIIQSHIKPSTTGYLEPFVGGANIIDKISCPKRVGCDIFKPLIDLLEHCRETGGDDLPGGISESTYKCVRVAYRSGSAEFPDWYYGLIGFCGAYGAKFFDGYARDEGRDIPAERLRNLKRQIPSLKGIQFECIDFRDIPLDRLQGWVIYCDPPYDERVDIYHNIFPKFSKDEFCDWVRRASGHNTVLVSEYEMPEDFECLWEKETKALNDSAKHSGDPRNKRVERLFARRGQ